MAAPDLAGENAGAGAVADISVEQIAGSSLQRADFCHAREWRNNLLKRGEMIAGKTAGCLVDQVTQCSEPSVNISGDAR